MDYSGLLSENIENVIFTIICGLLYRKNFKNGYPKMLDKYRISN